MNYQYKSTKLFTTLYNILLGMAFLLVIARWYNAFNPEFVVFSKEITTHINNFSLSLIACMGMGYIWLMMGVQFRKVLYLVLVFIIGNILCETMLVFLNTPDWVDAVYGIIGTLISFIYLYLLQRYGLKAIEENPK